MYMFLESKIFIMFSLIFQILDRVELFMKGFLKYYAN